MCMYMHMCMHMHMHMYMYMHIGGVRADSVRLGLTRPDHNSV